MEKIQIKSVTKSNRYTLVNNEMNAYLTTYSPPIGSARARFNFVSTSENNINMYRVLQLTKVNTPIVNYFNQDADIFVDRNLITDYSNKIIFILGSKLSKYIVQTIHELIPLSNIDIKRISEQESILNDINKKLVNLDSLSLDNMKKIKQLLS